MPLRMKPWQPTPLSGGDLSRFASDIERTFAPLGGQVVGAYEQGRTQRLFFEDIDAYLDISYGPGGRPIVGRGGGFYVPPQLQPRYDKGGGALTPTEISSWEVLGGAVGRARESAMMDEDPATKFSNFLGYEFGAGELEEGGWGTYAQWLEPGYERMFPAPALEMLGKSYAVPEVPMGAAAQVYPDVVLMTQGLGGFHKAVKGEEFVEAGIPGAQFAGSKGKQTGTRMYYGAQLGEKPEVAAPWAGGEMRAQILDVMFPLTQATATVEGQAYVKPGTTVSAQLPRSVALQGWDIERLSQVTGLGQGQFARRGEEFGLIYGPGGEPLYTHRERHWSEAQVTQAYVSIPETWAESAWYQGLTEQQRGMFRPEGGAVAGGMVVPSLEYEMRVTRGAGGSVSGKGAAFKTLLAERSFTEMIRAGITPEEAARLDIAFQEPPKEWYTAIYAAGIGLGQIRPGTSLFEGGRPREELIRQITGEMGRYVRPVTTFETVTAAQGAEYLAGEVPGVRARARPGGEVELERTFQAYVGPMAQLMRVEYPHGRSVYGGEEMEHYRQTNPALYQQIVEQGQQSTAHQGVLRSFWASYGKYDMPAVSYGDVYEQIQGMVAGTGGSPGELVRAMAAGPLAKTAIQFSGGAVLPSARDIMQMSATDIAGEEVNQLVVSWERAVQAAQVGGYMSRAAEMIGQRGFLKTAQEISVPGAMGPGTARSEIGIGQVLIGQEQFYQYARELYGRNPTQEQLGQLEAMVRSGNVMTQFTRFPHSDPFAQQDVFLQLQAGWGGQGPQVGPEEIAFHPYHAAGQHGDLDADLYRITSLSLQQAEGGGLTTDNAWARQARGIREQVQFMVDQLRETNPEAVAQAEAAASERMGRYADQVTSLPVEQRELMYWGDVVRLTQDFANEMYKHGEKELGKPIGPGEDSGDYMARMALGNLPTVQAATGKMYETWMGKALMGRTYNALIRDVGMRAREMLGADVAQSIMAIGRAGYQKAVDVGIYDPTMPLGRVEAGQDPRISFGLARLLEAWGSQSLFYGGGFAETLTGKTKWEGTKGEYRAPWHGMGTGSPWSSARMILGEFAMFGAEGTPQQMALALTGEERPELIGAISGARSWISTQGLTAQEVLKTSEGQHYLASIYQAAGLTEDVDLATSQGVLPKAMFAMLSTRTRETLARDPTMQQDFQRLSRDYAQATGRSLAEDMAEARLDQGTLELLSGRTRHLGEGDLVSQILSMADVAKGPLGQGIQPGRREPTVSQDVWASTLGMEDWRRFGSILQRSTQGRFEQGWGGAGTKAHAEIEEYFKGRKGYAMEEGAVYRGAVSEFGVTEFGDVGVTAKPDIVRLTEQGISVFDIKTYGLEDVHPEQLLFYGAAMEKKFGQPVSRLAYLRAGEGGDDELLKRIVEGTASEEELEAARKGGVLREVDVPKDLQAEAAKMLRASLKQEEKLRPLLQYLSDVDLEGARPGLEGSWTKYQATVKRLHETATQRQALGIRGGFSPYGESPVDRLGMYYGIDLRELGVRGARVLSPRAFLAEQEEYRDTASGMSDEEVEKAIAKIGYRAGTTKGDTIAVRQLTQGEMAKYGEDWNPYTIMRGRLAHEAGHVYAGQNKELLAAAQTEIEKMDPNDPFIQGLKQVYGDEWQERAASELIAHRLQARFGATVGPLEQKGLSTFEQMIIKLAGRIDVGGAGIPVEGAEGAAAAGEGAVYYQQRPGGGINVGGQGMSLQDLSKLMVDVVRQTMYPSEKELNWGAKEYQAAYRITSGEQGVLQEPGMRGMAASGLYWENARYAQLQELESYVGRGGTTRGGTPWKMQNVYRNMLAFSERGDAAASTGLEPETIEGGMESFKGLLGGSKEIQRAFKLMEKAGESVMKFDEAIQRTTETMQYLKESGTDLTQAQKQAIEKIALGDLQSAFTGAVRYGGADFLRGSDAQEAMQMLGGPEPRLGERIAGGAAGIAKTMMSGWGLIQMQRFWRSTGGYAMGQIPQAAEYEMGLTQAAAAGQPMGQYQPGGIATGLMELQAQRQRFGIQVGQAAYGAWGGMMPALGGPVADIAGVALPAIGAGLIGGRLAYAAGAGSAAVPIGMGIAGVGTALGTVNYAANLSEQPERMALGAAGGGSWLENLMMGTARAANTSVFGQAIGGAWDAFTQGRMGTWQEPGSWMGLDRAATTEQGRDRAAERAQAQQWYAEQQIAGQRLMSGELAGLSPEESVAAIDYATQQYAPRWMEPTAAAQGAAQWMAFTPGATNIRSVYEDPLFSQIARRGMDAGQYAGIAQQWNMGPTDWQQISRQQMSVSQGQAMQNEFVLGQWAGMQRLGVSGQAIRQMGYGTPVSQLRQAGVPERVISQQVGYGGGIGALPQMSNQDQMRMQRLMGGDRWAWTQYATGDLGLSSDVTQAFQTLLPGAQPADWMVTMEPGTGLPMHTTTSQYYTGGLDTEAAQIGGLRGIQWAQVGAQNRYAAFQEQQQRNAFQLNYAMQTGQRGPLAGGQVSPGFMGLASSVGGMWGLQDAATDLQARQAMAGFDYQSASLGMQARQFQEDWQAKWGRLRVQKGWAEEEDVKREKRYEAQDAWWLYGHTFKKDTADIQYGRSMEDLDEAIRFATGRQKLGLMKQKERVTEDYSRQTMYMEEEKDYWEKQKEWRDEDIEDARQKREEQQKWAEEDMLRAKRHNEERTRMQQGHIEQERAFWLERQEIEKTRTALEREFWKEQKKEQAAEIEKSQEMAKLQRSLREDQMKLMEDQQDRIALFQILIDKMGEGTDVLNQRVDRFNNLVRQRSAPESAPNQGGPEPQEFQEGGPVGVLPGGGRSMAIVAHEGEYVVPQQGQLVFRDDDRTITLLGRILGVLEEKAMINVVVSGQEAGSRGRIAEAAYNRYSQY